MVASDMKPSEVKSYFKKQGLATVIPYNSMVFIGQPEVIEEALVG